MRLITWNCQGAFRKKYLLIASQSPDLAVIPECEHPDKLTWKKGSPPTSVLWVGENCSRGLGIFSWTGLEMSLLDGYDRTIRHCAPVQVSAPFQFNLVAIWAMDHPDRKLSYSAQVYQAVAAYREFILQADTVFMGDFNSSHRSTPRSRIGNHTTLSNALSILGMISAYHLYFHERQGQEKRFTYFRGRKLERCSHIDYAFIPTRWLRRLKRVAVGEPGEWLTQSDHCPVTVELVEKSKESIV